jgi:hypothetical protein
MPTPNDHHDGYRPGVIESAQQRSVMRRKAEETSGMTGFGNIDVAHGQHQFFLLPTLNPNWLADGLIRVTRINFGHTAEPGNRIVSMLPMGNIRI